MKTSKIIRIVLAICVAIGVSIAFVALCITIISFIKKGETKKSTVNASWITITGELVQKDYGGEGGASMFKYWYNDRLYKNYSTITLNVGNIVVGEKYKILIDTTHPDIYLPVTWAPLFTQDELPLVDTTFGIIEDINNNFILSATSKYISKKSVVFVYTAQGKEFGRSQNLPPDYVKTYPELSIGKYYTVVYLKEDPQRAIIYLDKPCQPK